MRFILAHFLLTELLLPLLKAAPAARIVNVSALAHFYSEPIDVATVDRRERWDARQAYARSKLAQVYFVCNFMGRFSE